MATNVRALLAEVLQPLAASATVDPYLKAPESISKPAIMLGTSTVKPGPADTRAWTCDLYVVTPLTTPGPADDALDALLADVLDLLDANDTDRALFWESATRATYRDAYPCYLVSLTAHITPAA